MPTEEERSRPSIAEAAPHPTTTTPQSRKAQFTASARELETRTALSIPDLDDDVDTLTAALAYAAAGWYVLPAARIDPKPGKNPGSVVGGRWHSKSSRDPKQLAAWFAGTDHGIALHCGRSGGVVFDVDDPDLLPDVLRKSLDAAPYQSSRPDTPGRGHYLFLQPPGRTIGNGTGKLGGAWGEVRGLNGVIIAAPSWHPDGGEYDWVRTGPVQVLQDELADLLDDTNPASDAATDAAVAAFLAEHRGSARPQLLLGPVRKLAADIAEGRSRHTSATKALVWATDEARVGYYSAENAAAAIKETFINAMATQRNPSDRVVTGHAAVSEWDGILAWSVGQTNGKTDDEISARRARIDANAPISLQDYAMNNAKAAAAQAESETPSVEGNLALNPVSSLDAKRAEHDDRPPLYGDVAALLADELPEPPAPDVLRRSDGNALFYKREINYLFGDPEDGKTWVALAAEAEVLADGGKALFVDLDHNGMTAVVTRLLKLGAPTEALTDIDRFRYCEPEDSEHLARIIADTTQWAPDVATIDCVGELMAMRGASSDNADEYTATISAAVMPLVRAGAGVILIDHLAKGRDSRAYGAGGTMAKRRKLGGTSMRVNPIRKFTPGKGGAVDLIIAKDRHGGVKRNCEPLGTAGYDGGTFVLTERIDRSAVWHVTACSEGRSGGVSRDVNSKAARTYLQPARKLTDDSGSFTASELAGLVYGHPYTDAQRKAARRACDEMTGGGLLAIDHFGDGNAGDPRRWRVASGDPDE